MGYQIKWSEWKVNTGEQPVAGNVFVQYVFVERDADITEEPTKKLCEAYAGDLAWRIAEFSESVDKSDIISYRYRIEIPDEEEFEKLFDSSMI